RGSISNSTRHAADNLPQLLVGGGSGQLKGGRHLKLADKPSNANLLVTIMDKMDVPVEKVGGRDGEVLFGPHCRFVVAADDSTTSTVSAIDQSCGIGIRRRHRFRAAPNCRRRAQR